MLPSDNLQIWLTRVLKNQNNALPGSLKIRRVVGWATCPCTDWMASSDGVAEVGEVKGYKAERLVPSGLVRRAANLKKE